MKDYNVENMTSSKGNDVPSQFIITTPETKVFKSYNSIIAIKYNDGRVELDKYKWDYSKTTGKCRNQFLGETIEETRKKIESGKYKLKDLNK